MEQEEKVYLDLQKMPLKSEREELAQRRRKRVFVVLVVVLFFLLGVLAGYVAERFMHNGNGAPSGTAASQSDLFGFPRGNGDAAEVMSEIEYRMENEWLYAGEYDDLKTELENKAFYGMTAFDDDPYTGYMSAEELDTFSSSINLDYVGIGVEYSTIDGVAMVRKVFKDSPAEKAGMQPGDILVSVDGVMIEGLTSEEIRERVIGEEGTPVDIGVSRSGKQLVLTCIRAAVSSSAFGYKEGDHGVLEISSFGVDTAKEIEGYLNDMKDLDKLIIDLRGNTGGYQSSVRSICGLLIGPDKVYLRQSDVNGNEYGDRTPAGTYFDNFKRIVILIDQDTASAAEVCAICLKEQHPNVTLVGTTTFGKGVIQSTSYLSNGAALKLTTYYWYSPNGVSIHGTGIVPDVEVRMPDIYYETYTMIPEGEAYGYDSVDEHVALAQKALSFLDYGQLRTDGYFDSSTQTALRSFESEHGLEPDGVLDPETFEALISESSRALSLDESKDLQMLRAKEIIDEDQH